MRTKNLRLSSKRKANMAQRFFKPEEFSCKCGRAECDAVPVDMTAALKLEGLRLEFGEPMHINSACRCAFQNGAVGGKSDSQHLFGRAFDIHCPDGVYMRRLIILALKHGFSIGVKARMLHLDVRPGVPVVFGY